MTPPRRTRLSRWATPVSREAAYLTPEAVEVDSSEFFQMIRRRVLFEDVQLVTRHQQFGLAYLFATGFFAFLFLGVGMMIGVMSPGDGWVAAAVFFVLGFLPLVMFVTRLIVRVDVITVYGKRSKVTVRYQFRKAKAREAYGSICAAARNAQRVRPATFPGSPAPPLPADVPLPPL
jgi:hypothetical protein